jgi:hypothetical protein
MNKDQIRKAILEATGHPHSGVIVESVEAIVNEIWKIENVEKKSFDPVQETRVQEIKETR